MKVDTWEGNGQSLKTALVDLLCETRRLLRGNSSFSSIPGSTDEAGLLFPYASRVLKNPSDTKSVPDLKDVVGMLKPSQGEDSPPQGRGDEPLMHDDQAKAGTIEEVGGLKEDGSFHHPSSEVCVRLGYGAMLLGKVGGTLQLSMSKVLEVTATAARHCATAVKYIQALHQQLACPDTTGQQGGSSPAEAEDPASQKGSRHRLQLLQQIACGLFHFWADFCHGVLQLLQGAVDVRASLHCTFSQDFCEAMQKKEEDAAEIYPGERQAADAAEAAVRPCSDKRPAIFVPACMVMLGGLQVDVIRRIQKGLGEERDPSHWPGLESLLEANRMCNNWCSAAQSGLWKPEDAPEQQQNESQDVSVQMQMQAELGCKGICPVTGKPFRLEGPQLPLCMPCCMTAVSEEGVGQMKRPDNEYRCCDNFMSDLQEGARLKVHEDEFDMACMADSVELWSFQQGVCSGEGNGLQQAKGEQQTDAVANTGREPEAAGEPEGKPEAAGSPGAAGPAGMQRSASGRNHVADLGWRMYWESPKLQDFLAEVPLPGESVTLEVVGFERYVHAHDFHGHLWDCLKTCMGSSEEARRLSDCVQTKLDAVSAAHAATEDSDPPGPVDVRETQHCADEPTEPALQHAQERAEKITSHDTSQLPPRQSVGPEGVPDVVDGELYTIHLAGGSTISYHGCEWRDAESFYASARLAPEKPAVFEVQRDSDGWIELERADRKGSQLKFLLATQHLEEDQYRYLAAHNAFPRDAQAYHGFIRAIFHSDRRKAAVWTLMQSSGRNYLQISKNRDRTALHTDGWYLAVPQAGVSGGVIDLAITDDIHKAIHVEFSHVKSALAPRKRRQFPRMPKTQSLTGTTGQHMPAIATPLGGISCTMSPQSIARMVLEAVLALEGPINAAAICKDSCERIWNIVTVGLPCICFALQEAQRCPDDVSATRLSEEAMRCLTTLCNALHEAVSAMYSHVKRSRLSQRLRLAATKKRVRDMELQITGCITGTCIVLNRLMLAHGEQSGQRRLRQGVSYWEYVEDMQCSIINQKKLPSDGKTGVQAIARRARARQAPRGQKMKLCKSRINAVAVSPPGDKFATVSDDSTAAVWAVASGRRERELVGHSGRILSVAWGPDGKQIATGAHNSTAAVWDAATGSRLHLLRGHEGPVDSVAWAPDGSRVATASADGAARVWDASAGTCLRVIPGHASAVSSIAWGPDGASLATGAVDGSAAVWHAATGIRLHLLQGHAGPVNSVAWAPDGSRLATGSAYSLIIVWDVATGTAVHKLRKHTRPVESVAWSPDGLWIVSGSGDGTVAVWDAASGVHKLWLQGHSGGVTSAAWGPRGRFLFVATAAGTVHIHDVAARLAPSQFDGRDSQGEVEGIERDECRTELKGRAGSSGTGKSLEDLDSVSALGSAPPWGGPPLGQGASGAPFYGSPSLVPPYGAHPHGCVPPFPGVYEQPPPGAYAGPHPGWVPPPARGPLPPPRYRSDRSWASGRSSRYTTAELRVQAMSTTGGSSWSTPASTQASSLSALARTGLSLLPPLVSPGGSPASTAASIFTDASFWSDFQKAGNESESPLDALEVALDAMCSMKEPFFGRYMLLSSVERRVGGQGIVQFASIVRTQDKAAVKFYMDIGAFRRERDLYEQPALKSMMPATLAIEENAGGQCKTPYGYTFPPFVITECGQSLDEWARDNANKEYITILQALSHSVRALWKLHSTGYAHRDIKPGNILRRPKQHDWTLIDFGCAAQIGTIAELAYSMKYAPPEVMLAVESGCRTIYVDAAVDIWAVGVIAFELLTGERAFPVEGLTPAEADKAVQDAIVGRTPLPWEAVADGIKERLLKMRGLRRTVLRCLERDPAKRPSAEQLMKSWDHTFDDMQTLGTDWSVGSGETKSSAPG